MTQGSAEESLSPGVGSIRSALVICTKDRPDDLANALRYVYLASPDLPVLVADASTSPTLERVVDVVATSAQSTLLTCRPGLARQRNQAIDWIRAEWPDIEIVHFIDDDSEVSPQYFDEINAVFARNPLVAGVGGVLTNHPAPRYVKLKALFRLYSSTPGRVLSSGQSTMAHYRDDVPTDPERLSGGCMSYRLSLIEGIRFDDRLEGYSIGEDLFFSYAVSRVHPLAVAPEAAMVHYSSPVNRIAKTELALERMRLVHRWVRENRSNGLRASHFWLSVTGEVLMRVGGGLAERDRDEVAEGLAVARGALAIFRHPLPATGGPAGGSGANTA